jgi:biopolymer transport protein ExbD
MAFGGFDNQPGVSPMAEINTTPLVDVMLVLLVIFIITAPLFHQAVPIDLPKVDATRLEDKPHVVQVAIDEAGTIFWDGEAIHRDSLPSRLEAVRSDDPELHLRADRNTRYEKVADVMAAAQAAGIVKIAFVTEPAAR